MSLLNMFGSAFAGAGANDYRQKNSGAFASGGSSLYNNHDASTMSADGCHDRNAGSL
jgi:hypothetical protein